MFKKILIANRGEIANRIILTAKKLGIITVAVYSDADKNSLHVQHADEAYYIGPAPAIESYLNIDLIIQKAQIAKAEAIHPGYGFLSENPTFAKACEKAKIIFIGPNIEALTIMGSKQLAKQKLASTDVPLTPGYHGLAQDDKTLLQEAKRIGFPVLLKAAAGGGGKGMRAVEHENDFAESLAGARREAMASFANDLLIIEKLLINPRHIEIQIMADNHGNIVHLFERDCSIQRRHQKIIEEAPAPNLTEKKRQALAHAAVAVAKAVDYRGAGTIEFLLDQDEQFYFMEMNTRLQVEHPVTEMITGLDLVEWQLRIAANESLPLQQNAIKRQGHAIECRIYAEDPRQQFIPSIGKITFIKEPQGTGIRVDSGVTLHSHVTMHYDPMIAKLISWGDTRETALQRLKQALTHYYLSGIKTNIPFLNAIVAHANFQQETIHTGFLSDTTLMLAKANFTQILHIAAAFDYCLLQKQSTCTLTRETIGWQMHTIDAWPLYYTIDGERYELTITPLAIDTFILTQDDKKYRLQASLCDHTLIIEDGEKRIKITVAVDNHRLIIFTNGEAITVERFNWLNAAEHKHEKNTHLTAPMPAKVVAILKHKGDNIKAGECLMVLEAMKMEHAIYAPEDGTLTDIYFKLDEQVEEGAELAALQSTNVSTDNVNYAQE